MSDLLPCPFCGSTRLNSCGEDGRHWVRCKGCDASGPLSSKYDEEDDENWNTRTPALTEPQARATADAERLADALKSASSWLERWGSHVGSCRGADQCTCGLTLVRYETESALLILTQDTSAKKGDANS